MVRFSIALFTSLTAHHESSSIWTGLHSQCRFVPRMKKNGIPISTTNTRTFTPNVHLNESSSSSSSFSPQSTSSSSPSLSSSPSSQQEPQHENHQQQKKQQQQEPFPRWLRVAATAPVEKRLDVTDQVVSCISQKGGGFLSSSNLLSDLATCLVMEDIQPTKISAFYQALQDIDGLRLHSDSKQLLLDCCGKVVAENHSNGDTTSTTAATLPDTVARVFQISWRGSQGQLTHEIVADG